MANDSFKSMSPTPGYQTHVDRTKTVKCDECGTEYRSGDWPLCNGDPEKHR